MLLLRGRCPIPNGSITSLPPPPPRAPFSRPPLPGVRLQDRQRLRRSGVGSSGGGGARAGSPSGTASQPLTQSGVTHSPGAFG
ncbi:hypothetical protein JEQ12_009553 [Ovis aries]|uniref:Uncharacterized protein n=1 Tax=Ovis aries TaxID=9940 RepID=A0A836ADE5_SHEEP|nr:hypothetical protein JEQ12_009553 [Ovis aries]